MRFSLIFLPFLLAAQAPAPKTAPSKAAPKPAAAPAKPAASGVKPATRAKSAAAPKPATAKPAASAAKPKPAAAPSASKVVPVTDDEKIIYSLGLSIARSLQPFELTEAELAIVKQGIDDAKAGNPAVVLEEWGPKIQNLARARAEKQTVREKEVSKEYLAKAATEPGAVKSESGMIYKELQAGTGASPAAADTVKVHYRGTLVNGTEFDSSYKRNEPATFPLNGVIKCWTEGVQKMKVGGKAKLVCPSELAYGDQGRPNIPGGATLIFEVELLDVTKSGQ